MPVKQTSPVPDQLKTAIQNDRGLLGFVMRGSANTLAAEPPQAKPQAPAPAPTVAASAAPAPAGSGVMKHFDAANEQLKLTPQEQGLYYRHLKSVWGAPGAQAPMIEMAPNVDGKTYVLPAAHEGKALTAELALERAKAEGLERFPAYGSSDEAARRLADLKRFMERDAADRAAQSPQAVQVPQGLINQTTA